MKPRELSAAREEFFSESQEMLEQMEQLLPALQAWSGGEAPTEVVNNFFRLVHGLKGLSGMLGYQTISFLAHDLENLLAELRMGRLRSSEELVALLQSCLVAFHELLGSAMSGTEHAVNVNGLIAQIERFIGSHRWLESADLAARLELPETLLTALTDYEQSRLVQSVRQGLKLHRVRIALSFATFDVDLEILQNRIRGFGEVIATLPSSGGDGEDKIWFEILVASGRSVPELKEALELPEAEIEEVRYQLKPEMVVAPAEAAVEEVAEEPAFREGQSVRVSLEKIDAVLGGIGDLLQFKTQLGRLVGELRSRHGMSALTEGLAKSAGRLEKSILGLQDRIVQMRMVPVRGLFGRLTQMSQKLSYDLGKEIELVTRGADTELDKMVIEAMTEPLLHLLRNAVDHGIEPPEERVAAGKSRAGRIQIRASHQGKRILIEVEDDGAGMDPALIRKKAEEKGLIGHETGLEEQDVFGLLFAPGFSTRDTVTDISGRGVGMDVVRRRVVKLGGAIEIQTKPGAGTRWTIVLPVTLVIIASLIVRVADQIYAVPMSSVSRTYDLAAGDVPGGISDEGFDFEGTVLPVYRLDQIFELDRGTEEPPPYLLVAQSAERKMGFLVHEVRGREEIVVKPLGGHLAGVRGIAGATEIGAGPPVLVVDIGALIAELRPATRSTT